MPRKLNISEARARLPELARHVSESDEPVVLIEHRDLAGALALTTQAHLDYLNTLVEQLRKRLGEPFVLAGSVESELGADALETELITLREEERRLADARLDSFDE